MEHRGAVDHFEQVTRFDGLLSRRGDARGVEAQARGGGRRLVVGALAGVVVVGQL